MKKEIIAIIPARGGSKGVPKKNIRFLAGKPLINYSIHEAQKSGFIRETIVSTDDDEIAEISKSQGAIIIKRPAELSRDDSLTIDAVLHTIQQYELQGKHPDIIVLLQPTSPLRTTQDIDAAIELYLQGECDSVISVVETNHPPHWNMVLEGSYLQLLFDEKLFKMRRQDLPQTYLTNGAVYIISVETLKLNHSFFTQKTKPYIMSADKSIDIDSELDLFFAEALIKRNYK